MYLTFALKPWPLTPQDVDEGDEVTRNYVEGPEVDSLTRDAQLLPWFEEDLTHVDPQQEEPQRDFFLVSW